MFHSVQGFDVRDGRIKDLKVKALEATTKDRVFNYCFVCASAVAVLV